MRKQYAQSVANDRHYTRRLRNKTKINIYVDSRPQTPRSSVSSSIRNSPAQSEHNNSHDYGKMTESILALQYSLNGLKEELCDHMNRTSIQIQ